MFNNLFPLGTIVKLKEEPGLVMIVGRLVESEDDEFFEYVGCPFPTGIVTEEQLLFDAEDVEAVNFIGFQDEQELAYRQSLSDIAADFIEEE